MERRPYALGIRGQLLLVLSVFLVLPWLGYEYVREIERFLRDAQERTLAGTAQAVALALHERPRLFAAPADPIATFARERADELPGDAALPPPASPEIEQIVQGLSRTTARIWVVDRDLTVLARAGSLQRPPMPDAPSGSTAARAFDAMERIVLHPLYGRLLRQPTEDFRDDTAARGPVHGRDVEGALAGILTTDRRTTSDGKATIVSAAHPIWIGDQVRGVVVVEETTNRVLAERNRAFERLFNIVLAVLLVGSLALTWFASRLTARIRRLRDDAEAAIDAQGRTRAPFTRSNAGDEIGDLSRSFASALARLAQYAGYQEAMAARLAHELRTPVAVVRSSLDNLNDGALPGEARVYIERARSGLARLNAILTRMTEATRLEGALRDAERERFDLGAVVSGCVDGYRLAYPEVPIRLAQPGHPVQVDGAPDLVAQLLDKLVANAVEFRTCGEVTVGLEERDGAAQLTVANDGPPLPEAMAGRLFDSMVSVREAASTGAGPHLGLGLYIVRLIAQFHRGTARAENRADGRGVVVSVSLPTGVAPA
ncbi:MAG TPA: ATP-binding protein [Casimicrobiaceae bacterium]|jgi:dedicated sortase system histidine kinase